MRRAPGTLSSRASKREGAWTSIDEIQPPANWATKPGQGPTENREGGPENVMTESRLKKILTGRSFRRHR